MDEGSGATTEEYEEYFHRIKNIFNFSKHTKVMYFSVLDNIGNSFRSIFIARHFSRRRSVQVHAHLRMKPEAHVAISKCITMFT